MEGSKDESKRLFAEAETWYKNCLDIFPLYPKVYINLGKMSLMQGNYKQAYKYYKKALSITYSSEAQYGIAILNLIHGFKEQGKIELEKIIKKDPSYVPALIDLSVVYRKERRYNDAIRLCRKAISCKPDYIKAYYLLAELYNKIGRFDLADKVHKEIEDRKQIQ